MSPPSSILHPLSSSSSPRRRARAFTLIEMMVVIGIMVVLFAILLPTLSHVRKVAARKRMASDIQAIAMGLEAYKNDFGDYPRVEYTPGIKDLANLPEPPTGAQVLCWALIGPGALNDPTIGSGTTPPTDQHLIRDGADGPGFRTRCSIDQATKQQIPAGKVFGPYLNIDKFHYGNPADFDTTGKNDPNKALLWTLLDTNNQPILYAAASPKHLNPRDAVTTVTVPQFKGQYIGMTGLTSPATTTQNFIWDLTDFLGDTTVTPKNAVVDKTNQPLFGRPTDSNQKNAAIYRICAMLGDTTDTTTSGPPDGMISNNETPLSTGPYLLWMAGPDERFGPDPELTSGKPYDPSVLSNCDDVTNLTQ